MLDQLILNDLAIIHNNLLIMLQHDVIKEAYGLGIITKNDYKTYIRKTLDKVNQIKPMMLFTVSNKKGDC